MDTHNCQQVCVNTDGGFRCECDQGYQVNDDGITCSGMSVYKYYCVKRHTCMNTQIETS